MAVGRDEIVIYTGEDVKLTFTMDPVANVTGWTLLFTVEAAGADVISKAGVVENGANGVMSVTLADTDTDALRRGTYLYDLWRTDSGNERLLAIGDFVVRDVAREV